MDSIQKGVLQLMKSGITGESYQLPEGFELSKAMEIIKKHSLIPLIYVGAGNCGIPKSDPSMSVLAVDFCKNFAIDQRQMYQVNRLFQAFEENGIDYMPVKGCLMKKIYPSSDLRPMGDADILIKKEQYKKIVKIMKELGYEFMAKTDHDFSWTTQELMVELHYLLMSFYTDEYRKYFDNGWKLAKKHEGHRYAMTYEDEFIYLFIHYTKHYRLGGIGCRHVLDLWVFLREHQELDTDYVENVVKTLQVDEFYHNTRDMIDVWFNDGHNNDKIEMMSQFVFDSGSWGNRDNLRKAKTICAVQEEDSNVKGKWRLIKNMIFPSLDIISMRYKFLRKLPFLLPFVWVWRWIMSLLFRRNNVKTVGTIVDKVFTEDVSEYEKNMKSIGLDFKFEGPED